MPIDIKYDGGHICKITGCTRVIGEAGRSTFVVLKGNTKSRTLSVFCPERLKIFFQFFLGALTLNTLFLE